MRDIIERARVAIEHFGVPDIYTSGLNNKHFLRVEGSGASNLRWGKLG